MSTAHSRPVPRCTSSARRASRRARSVLSARSSSRSDSRKTFHSERDEWRAARSNFRALLMSPCSSCSLDCSSITIARVLGGDSSSARCSNA
eukprot:scaffold53860_cov31-Tisochrysis_lutea.AAC.4